MVLESAGSRAILVIVQVYARLLLMLEVPWASKHRTAYDPEGAPPGGSSCSHAGMRRPITSTKIPNPHYDEGFFGCLKSSPSSDVVFGRWAQLRSYNCDMFWLLLNKYS